MVPVWEGCDTFRVVCMVLLLSALFCILFLVHIIPAGEGCANYFDVCRLSDVVIVTIFVSKWIMAMEIDFICLTSDLLTSIISQSKPLHCFLQLFVLF